MFVGSELAGQRAAMVTDRRNRITEQALGLIRDGRNLEVMQRERPDLPP
jgi:hypothetical protein